MLWLYDEFETDFTYNGIVLNNAYDSDIHWVLNTMYKLIFKYPTVDNDLYSFIEKGMIVKADEHDRTNLFRIKDIDISENDKCITVTAYQKNYDFSKRLVNNFGRLRVNCMSVLDEWYSNFLSSEKDFSYYSDINAINSFVSHNDDTDNKLRTSFELLGGIADTYSADIDMHDKQISLLERLGRDTEEVLTTAKNISEFVNTSNSDEIVTRIYASSTFKVGDKYDKKDLREQHRQQLKALRESQKEYSQSRNAEKKSQQIQEEIAKKYAKELAKQNKAVKRSGTTPKSYSQIESEVRAKYQVREQKAQVRRAESQALADRKKSEIESLKARQKDETASLDEEITISLIIESPLINDYPFINEISISNNDLRTAEELEEWAMEYFTKQNIDKPKNSIKVTYEQLSENINRGDTVILKYLKYGVDERIRVVETHYDPMLKKWKEFILGEKEGRLGSEVSNASSGAEARANAYTDLISMDIERKVKERSENYDKLFKKNTDEINKKIEDGFEKAKASSEVITAKIDEDLEKKLAPIRNQVSTTVENYNRQFQATNLEISKNRVEATKQIQALSDRVNNIQDISNNETVRELRGLVNGATSKVTELQDSITREFTAVKKKNEDGLSAVKAEFTKGVDGLTSKVSSLEEYKNQDGTRTESLKQWVQRDTANQLSRERTEITRIVDSKGFVKNTEFSSKFNDNAQGINRKLDALETYKNQDGTRTSALKQWTQENTANQLVTARRNIENWVDTKGYVTNSVLNNKVQETASSFSREISNVRNSIPTSVGGRNYIIDSNKLNTKQFYSWNKWEKSTSGNELVLTKIGGSDTYGFWFNLTDLVKTQFQNEELTWSIDIKASRNMTLNNVGFETNGRKKVNITTEWQRISHTFINKFTNVFAFVFYNPTANFNNGDKIHIKLPKLEKGNVATDWTPAPEDNQQSISELNTWKQTANQTLNTVTSTLNDTVRHAQLRIGADKIDFGSNKVFDGRNLASMLSVSPESIQAITDRLVISPANENLVKSEFRNRHALGGRDVFLNRIYAGNELAGDYYFAADITAFDAKELKAMIHVKYTDGTNEYLENKFPSTDFFGGTQETTVKVPLKSNKTIEFIEPIIFQPRWSNFDSYILGNIKVYKKKSAELIVDGTIEGKHIKSSTIETGHLKAGSVTSNIIAAEAIKSTHLKVDDAMIRDLVSHKAFVTKLWAQDAFIKTLQATKIQSTQISTETLRGVTIEGAKFLVGRTGILDTSDSVLRFSTPFEWGGTSGVGMQLRGSAGGGFNQGLNIYRVDDVRYPNTPLYTPDEVALSVFGEIRGAFKINSMPKSGSLTSRMGVAVMSNVSTNTPIRAQGYPGAVLYSIRSIFLRSGGGPTQIWVNDGTGGNATFGVNVANMESDIKLKENISISNHNGLDVINKFTFHSFDWKKDKFGYKKPHTKIGLIAQEVQEIQDDLVYENPNALALDEFRLLNIALKAIQELSQKNTNLKSQLKEMDERLSKLETLQQ